MKSAPEPTHDAWKPSVRISEMPGAEVIELPLHAVLIGNGPPLVLLHGLAVSGEMYTPIVPALAHRHRLVIPDLRGQGASASLPGPYTPQQLATDLAGLLRHLRLRRPAVLGYSQGGPIALQLVHDHPELVGRLILVCTYAFNMATRRERFEGLLAPWVFRILGPRLVGQIGKIANVTGGKRLTKEQLNWLARLMAETPRRTGVRLAQGAMAFDGRPWLTNIDVPTVVITGADDKAVPPHHGDMLARGIPGARLVEIAAAGHFLICTHPEELAQIIAAATQDARLPRSDGDDHLKVAGDGASA
jgi:pimeloyl-ACP methyl ester carboxylesterase